MIRDRLIGAALARWLIGFAGVLFYLSGYAHRGFLWGPRSPVPWDPRQTLTLAPLSFSLYRMSPEPRFFEIIYHAGLVVVILFTVRGGRTLTLLHWLFLTSLIERNPLIVEGGERLARILLFFLIFVETDRFLAPGSRRRRTTDSEPAEFAAFRHNVAVRLCIFQLALVYVSAALGKLQGEQWRNGTALYYAARLERFHMTFLLDSFTANPILCAAGTYLVVAVQLFYPVALLHRTTRVVVPLLAAAMHLAIGLTLGLVSFSLVMIGSNALVLPDRVYLAVYQRIAKRRPRSCSKPVNS